MADLHVVILAAGKGTRMKSALPKVLHRVAGLPMIEHVLAASTALQPRSTTLVVGHQADSVRAALLGHPGVTFVVQEPQLGTGHALLTTEPVFRRAAGTLVLLSGDVPLLSAKTLKSLVDRHESAAAAATVVTAVLDQPRGYGRIVRAGRQIARIVEDRDATPAEREMKLTRASTRSLSTGCSKHFGISPRKTRKASTTCPTSLRSTGSAGSASKR